MHTLTLSTNDIAAIVGALLAVSPSGGGSHPHTLAGRLISATSVFVDDSIINTYVGNVLRDATEAGAIIPNRACAEHHNLPFFLPEHN